MRRSPRWPSPVPGLHGPVRPAPPLRPSPGRPPARCRCDAACAVGALRGDSSPVRPICPPRPALRYADTPLARRHEYIIGAMAGVFTHHHERSPGMRLTSIPSPATEVRPCPVGSISSPPSRRRSSSAAGPCKSTRSHSTTSGRCRPESMPNCRTPLRRTSEWPRGCRPPPGATCSTKPSR